MDLKYRQTTQTESSQITPTDPQLRWQFLPRRRKVFRSVSKNFNWTAEKKISKKKKNGGKKEYSGICYSLNKKHFSSRKVMHGSLERRDSWILWAGYDDKLKSWKDIAHKISIVYADSLVTSQENVYVVSKRMNKCRYRAVMCISFNRHLCWYSL